MAIPLSTAIHAGKYRVPSDPRSQASDGAVSTMMGDRMGILCAVVFTIFWIFNIYKLDKGITGFTY